jgi:hypothetical protein
MLGAFMKVLLKLKMVQVKPARQGRKAGLNPLNWSGPQKGQTKATNDNFMKLRVQLPDNG